MSIQDSDISWQLLGRIVKDWAGSSAQLTEVQPLEGGVINTTLCLTLSGGQRAVLKISPHRVNRDYDRESHQLDLLRSLGVPTPCVYSRHIGSLDEPNSFILMEFVEGIDLAAARQQCGQDQFEKLQRHLAEIVLKMHEKTSPVYGRVMPGSAPMFDTWPAFFRHVYDPIMAEALKCPDLGPKDRKQLGKIHEKLDGLLQHGDAPRLVHWDIWSTNVLTRPDEKGDWKVAAILDPVCKYAHAEAEIAYMDLFHTSTHAFNKAYQQAHRLDDGYHRVRKNVYQFYSLIDHVNLFGHDYVKPMLTMMEKVPA